MGLRPTEGDEKQFLPLQLLSWKRSTPLCHLDRSAA
jgi:hypothetical protein